MRKPQPSTPAESAHAAHDTQTNQKQWPQGRADFELPPNTLYYLICHVILSFKFMKIFNSLEL